MFTESLQVGFIAGVVLALFHALWAAMVALGWAQPLMDFIFWAHFISPVYHIEPFALGRAAVLIGLTFTVGLSCGLAACLIWNSFRHGIVIRTPVLRRLARAVR